MFCSSLRQRKDWAPMVPVLSRTIWSGWKETRLDGYDVSFPLTTHTQSKQRQSFFKILLLSAEESKTAAAKARIERLSMLDGGKNVAVILLLEKNGRVDSLMGLQMRASAQAPVPDIKDPSIVTHGMPSVPIIPISSAAELVGRLDALRRQCAQVHAASVSRRSHADEEAEVRGLASHCVHGQALPQEQVDILTDISAGLGGLAQLVLSADGQRQVCDLLGDVQGSRVISFFTHGHEANRRLSLWAQHQA
ncbi:hypothetical protein V8C42DRAFT_347885 [Trichoderma barbatum]